MSMPSWSTSLSPAIDSTNHGFVSLGARDHDFVEVGSCNFNRRRLGIGVIRNRSTIRFSRSLKIMKTMKIMKRCSKYVDARKRGSRFVVLSGQSGRCFEVIGGYASSQVRFGNRITRLGPLSIRVACHAKIIAARRSHDRERFAKGWPKAPGGFSPLQGDHLSGMEIHPHL